MYISPSRPSPACLDWEGQWVRCWRSYHFCACTISGPGSSATWAASGCPGLFYPRCAGWRRWRTCHCPSLWYCRSTFDDDGSRRPEGPEGKVELGQPVTGVQRLCVDQEHQSAPSERAVFHSSCSRIPEVLQEDVVDHQQRARLDGGEHAWSEGQLHYLVGAGDLCQEDVATGLSSDSSLGSMTKTELILFLSP